MAAPTTTPTADVVYEWVGQGQTSPDADHDWAFLHLIVELTRPLWEVEQVVRASAGRPGWAAALDPDTVPAVALDWLAQWVGVRLPAGLSDAAKRARIKDRPNARRGTPAYVVAAAQAGTTDSAGEATMFERRHPDEMDTDDPDRFVVVIYTEDGADEAAAQEALDEGRPAHLIGHVLVRDGLVYQSLELEGLTYDELDALGLTYDQLKTMKPSELQELL